MRALIFATAEAPGVGALDIAGRPLLIRQLQWLRDLGIEDVTIEIQDGPLADACAELVLGTDPLCAGCSVLPSHVPVGVTALAARAGLAADELFLGLPANVVAQARFALPERISNLELGPPPFASERPAIALAFRTRREVAGAGEPRPGWALHVNDALTAHSLSCAAITGQADGLLVHAAEVKPGIWYARGARVAEDATLLAPLLIGADARVFARARLGPNVVVGRGAVIERDAVLSEVSVAPHTLVGEDVRVRQAYIDASGFTSFADGSRTELRDPLQLSTLAPHRSALSSRLLAALLLGLLLLPWGLVSGLARLLGRRALVRRTWRGGSLLAGTLGVAWLDLAPRLLDVVAGRRNLVGVAEDVLDQDPLGTASTRPGALDIARALAGTNDVVLPCMVAWYLLNKSGRLDRELLRAWIRAPRELAAQGLRSGSF